MDWLTSGLLLLFTENVIALKPDVGDPGPEGQKGLTGPDGPMGYIGVNDEQGKTGTRGVKECVAMNGWCQQDCYDNQGQYVCGCTPGYELTADAHTCVDVNECARSTTGNENCRLDEDCVNTVGGFTCVARATDHTPQFSGLVGSPNGLASYLLTDHLMIGLIVWLSILTLMIASLGLYLLLHKRKEKPLDFTTNSNLRPPPVVEWDINGRPPPVVEWDSNYSLTLPRAHNSASGFTSSSNKTTQNLF